MNRKATVKRIVLFGGIFFVILTAAVIAGIIYFKAGGERKPAFSFGAIPEGEMPLVKSGNTAAVPANESVTVIFGKR